MNLRKIKSIDRMAMIEAEKAVAKIYKKYSKQIVQEISKQIPKGLILSNGNGISILEDNSGNTLKIAKAWGLSRYGDDPQIEYLSTLQYSNNIYGGFTIPYEIKGTKI